MGGTTYSNCILLQNFKCFVSKFPHPKTGDLGFQIIAGGQLMGGKNDPKNPAQKPECPQSGIQKEIRITCLATMQRDSLEITFMRIG